MEITDRIPLFVGTLKLVLRNGQREVVQTWLRRNTLLSGALCGVPYNMGINNSAGQTLSLRAIDYSMSSVNVWETGTVPTMSEGGTYVATKVSHTNSYTAPSTKTIKRLRMRRKGVAFSANDLPNNQGALSEIGGLNITLQTNWTLQTTWTLSVL